MKGPRHPLHWSPRFTRRAAESSLGGNIYSFSKVADHAEMVMEFCTIFGCKELAPVRFAYCDSLVSRSPSRKVVAEAFLAGYFSAIQDTPYRQVLRNVSRIRGPPNPADGLTQRKSDLVPLPSILMKGGFHAEERRSAEKTMGRGPHSTK